MGTRNYANISLDNELFWPHSRRETNQNAGVPMSLKDVVEKSRELRQNNKMLKLLELIWKNPGIARRDLGPLARLSRGAVTSNITPLIEEQYVVEGESDPENENRLGRGSIGLYVAPDFFYTIGILILSDFTAVLYDASGKAVKVYHEPFKMQKEGAYRQTLEALQRAIPQLMGAARTEVVALGIACTGIIDFDSGEVFSSSSFPGIGPFNLKNFIRELCGLDPFLINISHLNPIMEKLWGAAKNIDNFITVDDSCTAGFFLNGELFRGWQKHAGELGYMKVTETAEIANDGRGGVVALKALSHVLSDQLRSMIANGGRPKILEYMDSPDQEITTELLVQAIEGGDKYVEQKMAERYEVIGEAIVNTAYMLNPEAIFLEAWTARCPQCTLDIVERKMGSYGLSNWHLSTRIRSCKCTMKTAPRAVAYLAAEVVFRNSDSRRAEQETEVE